MINENFDFDFFAQKNVEFITREDYNNLVDIDPNIYYVILDDRNELEDCYIE